MKERELRRPYEHLVYHMQEENGARLTVERIGKQPAAIFVAGIHGDETDIIEPLRGLLEEYVPNIGDHVRVLYANPEAISRANRRVDGIDLNRQFTDPVSVTHPQAELLADTVRTFDTVHTVFSFHEDWVDNQFYMYYHPYDAEFGKQDDLVHQLQKRLRERVRDAGYPVFTGEDDPELQIMITDGYAELPADERLDSTFEMWAANAKGNGHPHMRRAFVFEIPGRISDAEKTTLLRMVFEEFILPYGAETSVSGN